jgi:probable rRNA maturation factor
MFNSVIRKGNVSLFYSDTGRVLNSKNVKTLIKNLSIALGQVDKIQKGKITKSIKINKKIELSLTMCGNAKIKSLNKQYRNKNNITDVLSFPMFESLRNNSTKSMISLLETVSLGDIVISKDVAYKQSRKFGISYEQEVIHLFVHGLLHLLGFDHELSIKEERIMEDLEQNIVKNIYKDLELQGIVERYGRND